MHFPTIFSSKIILKNFATKKCIIKCIKHNLITYNIERCELRELKPYKI